MKQIQFLYVQEPSSGEEKQQLLVQLRSSLPYVCPNKVVSDWGTQICGRLNLLIKTDSDISLSLLSSVISSHLGQNISYKIVCAPCEDSGQIRAVG